jgi:hypothetical protein
LEYFVFDTAAIAGGANPNTGSWVQLGTEKDSITNGPDFYTFAASSGGSIGDPIIVPVHGRVYSLPCDNNVYRYLGDRTGRVVVNVQHELSDNLTIKEIDSYCAKVPQTQQYAKVLKETKEIPPYAFPRYVYIAVDGHEATFDLKMLMPIAPSQNGTLIHRAVGTKQYTYNMAVDPAFTIQRIRNCGKGIGLNKFPMYNDEVGHQVIVTVQTETYGKLKVNLFRFKNEQLRSGVSVTTERAITMENSTGAIVCPTLAKRCRLKKLHSLKMVSKSQQEPRTMQMTFIEPTGRKTVMII